MPHILLLVLVHQLSGRVCCRLWVTQSEGGVDGVVGMVGGNVTLNCQIHSDTRDEVSQCRAQWYVREASRWREVGVLERTRGRFVKAYDGSTTNTTFTMVGLTMNDTDTYYCTLMCRINGRSQQYHGNGTQISIFPSPSKAPPTSPAPESQAEDPMLLVPLFILLALKLLVAIVTDITSHAFFPC
ncbi:hypothetical protein AGOR_G00213000 [Albula goreensis]|uniref:Ig-like domain-containing protein n=1 Tax=Albula goreensis TaxID=1534307 RepID=A0A8T3CQU3_9TELE|nr:hypothetical protein AGOR_G00213000 [Albula goreensis]